ncbi:chromosome partitioning protein ParA [Elstera cyanobacteriorum]|uniref:Protein parA n=1 Tax=Elstera cyanobacteriorum TaxID=2022747 RepID=A0A255XJY0_9PROT|nr:ParA family protein [Elstera cyanobacteriorum]OYQ16590.1 protein parA [Elstera cyanobacteriorum]GGA03460.1 chromosome partitioning protein ParA [Elstera cyanobacteriorum]
MPVVVVASPKGGAGKSTTSVILGTELALAGATVQMLDCDPNGSLSLWASKQKLPERVALITDVTESSVVRTIKTLDQDGHVVIVDLEGVASRLVSRAISQADLVITPMRATILDATIGARAIQLIAEEEEALARKIRHAVVFTATKHVKSLQHRGIENSLREQGVDIIKPDLMERSAYSALFEFGGDLTSLPPQGNMEAARANASDFAHEVYKRLIAE